MHDFYQRVRSWWQRDRIRISPTEGRLLRVEPGDMLTFQNQDVVVLACTVAEHADGCVLHLTCETSTKTAVLELQLTAQGELLTVRWEDADDCRECHPSEIEVWPRRHLL